MSLSSEIIVRTLRHTHSSDCSTWTTKVICKKADKKNQIYSRWVHCMQINLPRALKKCYDSMHVSDDHTHIHKLKADTHTGRTYG